MGKKKPRFLISGAQPGFGIRGKLKNKVGGRIKREGAFPAEGLGRTLSGDDSMSTFGRTAKSTAAKAARVIAANKRDSFTRTRPRDSSDSDPAPSDIDSDDLDGETEAARAKAAKRERLMGKTVDKGRAERKRGEEMRKAAEAAARRAAQRQLIVLGDSDDDKEEVPAPRKNAVASGSRNRFTLFAPSDSEDDLPPASSLHPPRAKPSSSHNLTDTAASRVAARRAQASSARASSSQALTSHASASRPAPPSPAYKVASTDRPKFSSLVILNAEQAKANRAARKAPIAPKPKSYGKAVPLALPPGTLKRRHSLLDEGEEEEKEEEEDELDPAEVREGAEYDIAIPGSDDEDEGARRKYEREFAESEKVRKEIEERKRTYREERGPGYSNPMKN